LDASNSLLFLVFGLDGTLSAGGGYGGVNEAIVLTKGDTRLEYFRVFTEKVGEVLGESFVEFLGFTFNQGQVERESTSGE